MAEEKIIREKYMKLVHVMTERSKRTWAATEALALGRGGISVVSRAPGMDRNTIAKGIRELDTPETLAVDRIRRPGGGRKRSSVMDPTLAEDLERLIDPVTRGDPESPLRWTCKSVRKLAAELGRQGHQISHTVVAALLHELGYSLQANRKVREGKDHPDRDAQFEKINRKVRYRLSRGQPVISVDCKKKELVGDFKNGGREWHLKGQPEEVRVHDFKLKELGKAIPYGVYDVQRNAGWVSVGVSHETAAFAVATIGRWWKQMGSKSYPAARCLQIVADSGGSNGSRVRLWKWELQQLANQTGLSISVSHLPPGTSKWNKIEHRLFSYITQNWRGKPLLTHATIVNLISSTHTKAGLKVRCVLDRKHYPLKVDITEEQMASIRITRDDFHGEWNYTIRPQ
jgi:transposase